MKKQEMMSYKKRIESLLAKMEEMDIAHDFRSGYNFLGYSYNKGSYYCLCFRTGREEDVVYKGLTDIKIRKLLYIYDLNDLERLCLTVEDIFNIMKKNHSTEIFATIYFLMEEALNDAIYTLEDCLE